MDAAFEGGTESSARCRHHGKCDWQIGYHRASVYRGIQTARAYHRGIHYGDLLGVFL